MFKLSDVVLAEFFEDFSNILSTGIDELHALAALKETTVNKVLVKEIEGIENKTCQGQTLAQAMQAAGIFPWIIGITVHAGEQAGKLPESTKMLARYFRQKSDTQKKAAQAFIYPIIVFILLCAVMVFICVNVVPRLNDLLPAETFNGRMTQCILGLSSFLQAFWPLCTVLGLVMVATVIVFSHRNPLFFERILYQIPVVGLLVKEASLAVYFFNLSILLKSGVPVIKAIQDLNTMHSGEVGRRIFNCGGYMLGGLPFWESLKTDPFFPAAAVFTLRRGEEMARLDDYCLQLAEYFNKRLCGRLEILAQLLQPVLLAIGGMFLATIAFAFLMPIYGGLARIAGG